MLDEVLLDDIFTYGGAALALAASAAWIWVAVRAWPTFEAFVREFDDELHHGASPVGPAGTLRWTRVRDAALALTAVAVVSLSLAYMIPG